MNAKLIIVGGDAKRTSVTLKKLPATIGRAREATISVPHTLVSRNHCEIFERDCQLFVRDLKSLNGTYVNNQKITDATPLPDGQLLTLGNVTFRAVYQADQPRDLPAAVEDSTGELQHDETVDADFVSEVGNGAGKFDPKDETDRGLGKKIIQARENQQKERAADLNDSQPEPGNHVKPQIAAGTKARSVGQQSRTKPMSTKPSRGDVKPSQFVFDDEVSPADKSICLGAMQKLPEPAAQASFTRKLVLDTDDQQADAEVDPVRIDVEDDRGDRVASQSSLDDFFRKMPK